MEQKKYLLEDKYRNDWVPLMSTDKNGKKTADQKYVKITEEEAEIMNIDSDKTGIRYILDESKPKKKDKKESPLMKAKRLISEIESAETVESVEEISKGGTPSVLKAAKEKIEQLSK